MRSLVLGHLVYLYTPIGILATIAGILMGGQWVWVGMAIFGFNIVMDTLTGGIHLKGAKINKKGEVISEISCLIFSCFLFLIS